MMPQTGLSLSPEQIALRQVVLLTNKERTAHGLPPLKLQENLSAAAAWMAQDMASRSYFAHTDHEGRSIDPRLPAFGYGGYSYIGENIAAGQESPMAAVSDWMQSPHHRENLLSPDYSEIGVGYADRPDSLYHSYWVQDFGSRFDVYPVVIDNEAPVTRAPEVSLYIYGAGWARQMRLSNDGLNWTDWEPYQPHRAWTLAPGFGTRTVFVELRNGQTIRQTEDSIELIGE
ncbi:MAG TPA: CAP domain-containing protein [Chthonomonadaceae bacterium]|nr:CAP domain-containing protein [Chthonomonadaceae bacterium]